MENGPFTEPQAASLFAQILLSMEYLHSLNIVHRDVKPENILYTAEGSSSIKLIDFGYAGVWSPEKPLTGLCGTPDYVAPEVLSWYDEDEEGTPYGSGSDLWSLGVLLYVILSGCSPFSADEEDEILKLVETAQYVFHEQEFGSVSAEAKDLIAKLLVADPAQRFTMPQVLSHPWLASAISACRAELAAAPKKAKPSAGDSAAKGSSLAGGGKPAAMSTRTASGSDVTLRAAGEPAPTIEARVNAVDRKPSARCSKTRRRAPAHSLQASSPVPPCVWPRLVSTPRHARPHPPEASRNAHGCHSAAPARARSGLLHHFITLRKVRWAGGAGACWRQLAEDLRTWSAIPAVLPRRSRRGCGFQGCS